MQANRLLATRRNGATWRGCSVRNKMLVERNNRPFPNCTTPYGVECGGCGAFFYQYLNPDGFGAGFCKSPVAEARNEYTYSASGQKLKVVQKWNPSFSTAPVIGSAINTAALKQSKTTDYIGNMIYENGALKRILIDGGYVEGGVYHYFLTDHLGNNRLVVNSSGTVVQKNHYYPFGTAFAETAVAEQGKQPYKFGNKELDQMNGLNWYDFSARFKDDFWFRTPDPLAWKHPEMSLYCAFANNPVRFMDPTGRDIVDSHGRRALYVDRDGVVNYTRYATTDIRRVADALNLTETGRSQLRKADASDIHVKIEISTESKIVRKDDGMHYTYGETTQGNYNANDNYGKKVNSDGTYGIKEAKIVIYVGTIIEDAKFEDAKHAGLTTDQAIGAVAGHEIVHATDKVEINKDIKAELARGSQLRAREIAKEIKPNQVEQRIIEQSKKLNEE